MNRLALLPWRLSARALGRSSIGQAVGAGAASWHTETQVGIVLEAHMWQNKRAWVLDAHMQALFRSTSQQSPSAAEIQSSKASICYDICMKKYHGPCFVTSFRKPLRGILRFTLGQTTSQSGID